MQANKTTVVIVSGTSREFGRTLIRLHDIITDLGQTKLDGSVSLVMIITLRYSWREGTSTSLPNPFPLFLSLVLLRQSSCASNAFYI